MTTDENVVTISPDDPLLSVAAVAKMFSVKPYTVRTWINQGKLKGHLLSGRWRIQKSEVQRYANELFGDKK
jgi:excisionase family DNA binding protein